MEALMNKVKYYIQKDGLKKKCRKREKVHKRFYLFHILRREGLTYSQIGSLFNLDHSTVIAGIKKYKILRKMNDKLLLWDIGEYLDTSEFTNIEYDLLEDLKDAHSIQHLETIKKRIDRNLYKEFRHGKR